MFSKITFKLLVSLAHFQIINKSPLKKTSRSSNLTDAFSLTQFSKFYLSENLQPSILLQQLQITPKMVEIEDKMQNIIYLVHDKICKFTVIGWYKRGVISDKSMLSNNSSTNNIFSTWK